MDNSNFCKEYLKESILTYPPISITIGITSACTNRCLFCSYHGEDAKVNSNVYGLPFMLSLDDFKKIVDMAYDGGVKKVHVCGTGEPFLNVNILDMLDYVIAKYEKVSFQTNFSKDIFERKHFLDEIVKRSEHISFINVDVCSSKPEEHNMIKIGSSYNDLLDSLEYLSKRSKIHIVAYLILTKSNWHNIKGIIDDFLDRGINNFKLEIGNLFSYDYSEFTSSENVYISTDKEITEMLEEVKEYGKNRGGVQVDIPRPADETTEICNMFWTKFQTWPVKGCDSKRYGENMVPMACGAVVRGDLCSLGYIFDYKNIMEAWNSPRLVEIRKNLLHGVYPSEYCKKCYLCNLEDSYYKKCVESIRLQEK